MKKALALAAIGMTGWIGMAGAGDFSSEAWRAEGEKPPYEISRNHMLPALENHLTAGMAQDEILALLGEPESRTESELVYDLGPAPYGIDYEYFVIILDDEGRLAATQFRRG